MSVFEDSETQKTKKFWALEMRKNLPETFKNKVLQKKKSDVFIEISLLLSRNCLVKTGPNSVKKFTFLDWKTIEPFQENNSEVTRFGFSVSTQSWKKEFYVESEELLIVWLTHLSSVSIMADFEYDFSMIKEIGSGSFGTVYLAANNDTCDMFAVKVIGKHSIIGHQENLTNLMNEIKFMRKLDHPNIVKLHYVYESPTHIYLVIDYLEGGDLYDRIMKRKTFNEETAKKFAEKLLDVISYMSSLNIVHRDLKLENILMVSEDDDCDFKLADFGLATEVNGALKLRCGSPGYTAPEILRKCSYGLKVDIFSAGVIIYILLCGRMPFWGKTLQEILQKNQDCKISFKHKSNWKISKLASDLILRLTDPLPKLRPLATEALNDPWFRHLPNLSLPQRCLASRSKDMQARDY